MEGPKAPRDPEKMRPYFYILKDKEIFGSKQEDGTGIQFVYESDGRLINSAQIAGNITDQEELALLENVEGFRKLVHSIGISVELDDPRESVEFVFQMYGKKDLYGGGTNLKTKLPGDGMERKIDLSDYTWTEDDDIPGQIKFIFQIPELLGKASVRLYLNDGYDAPKETAEEKIDVRSEEYREMIQRSLMNFGNTCRIQRVIEKARDGKEVTLAYIGGSITQGAGAIPIHTKCYAYQSCKLFQKRFAAQDNVRLIKAGVGGTPSELGMIRFDRDVLRREEQPDLVVIDSIQTMRCTDIASSSGTVSQVKESSARFLNVAKTNEIPTFIVGHVNKDGAIAGPKVMEHIVDTVLYFEGDKTLPYRVLRAVKNRYGSTNEIGMFDMTGKGLEQIENPSQVMLEGRPIGISGTCVACVMEGTRPVLSEIQALVTKTAFPSPRRTASGFDYNRMYLLLAVLEKRAGYVFGNQDVYINIIGGLKLDETACDLPVCLAMASSLLDLPVPEKTLAIGEVGLGGEVRSVPHLETRLREAQRVGFDTAIVPKHNLNMLDAAQFPGLRLVGVAYLREAINAIKINK